MLPSTGHFKVVDCPFLESGLCERPHCHFRHGRRDPQAQQLVLEVVREALQRRSDADPGAIDGLISDVVRRLTPSATVPSPEPTPPPPVKPTYNPTPISELNKLAAPPPRRHIPVPYTPNRPPRSQPRPSYVPSSGNRADAPTYTPQGAKPSGVAYEPGAAPPDTSTAYTPEDTGYSASASEPAAKSTADRYRPTPLPELRCGEPKPKKLKTDEPLAGLEDMQTEFELLDEIIADERPQDLVKPETEKVESRKSENGHRKSSSAKDKRSSKDRQSKSSEKHSSKSSETSKRKSNKSSDAKEKSDSKSSDSKQKSASTSSDSLKRKSDSKSKKKSDSKSSHHKSSRSRSSSSSIKDKSKSSSKSKSKKEQEPELIFKMEDDYIELFDSDSDEDAIAEECLKIFEEYVPVAKNPEIVQESESIRNSTEDDESARGKKRVAHASSEEVRRSSHKAIPDHKGRAAKAMAERYNEAKRFHEAKKKEVEAEAKRKEAEIEAKKREFETEVVFKQHVKPSASSKSKIRIAHVPNVSTMLDAKKALQKPKEAPVVKTVTQTVSKGAARVAHVPNEKFCDRPGVLEPLTSKVPVNVRTKYVHMMIDECLKIYLTAEDAYERALREELATSKRCNSVPIYKNSAVLAVSRLRKETQEAAGVKKSAANGDANSVSHSKILDGKSGEKCSWSIVNKYKKDNRFEAEFKGLTFYNNVGRWKMTEDELRENGFPRPHPDAPDKGRAKIYVKNTKQKPPKGNLRTCRRCHKEYTVDKRGFHTSEEECIYHPNNKYKFRGEVKYQCCGQDGSSDGCLSATCHVYEYIDYDNLRGYVKTLPKEVDSEETTDFGVYALDCEMCYTTNGLDLTRVTVVDSSNKVVYESLVKPIFPIIDYNTRYSGLTEESMSKCTTTLLDVQATFLHMFSDKTILIGHSLESDFKALKLIHDTVVDTSVLFPHKMGPPYKRALRNLSSDYLKKIIQNAVEGGHDSAEDALVCMELVIWKLKEELKIR